jgi:hypothetical protein
MREILSAVEVTAAPAASNVRPVPLDVLEQKAIRANSRVVAATCVLDKAQRALEQAQADLTDAELKRLEAQYELLHRHIESGAFEGVKNFQALATAGRAVEKIKAEDPGKETGNEH